MKPLSFLSLKNMSAKKVRILKNSGKLFVNENYQRRYVWKPYQRQEFIQSILEYNPIGVLVLWRNKKDQLEILDGQQRVETIMRFYKGTVMTLRGKKYSQLGIDARLNFDAYPVNFLELEQSLTADQISTIFIRLQEGTSLSNGEKIFAFRGNFRDAFVASFNEKQNENLFGRLSDNRARARFLAAKLLFLELESNYAKSVFPYLAFREFIRINNDYKHKPMSSVTMRRYNTNIQFLGKYLYGMLKALSFEDILSAYLLLSYFEQKKINEEYEGIKFKDFMLSLHRDLQKFKLYDAKPPKGMSRGLFQRLKLYKQYNKKGTTPDSLEGRFVIMKQEWKNRIGEIREKDPQRLYTQEQKIELYFKQQGICPICNKEIVYGDVEADHIEKHETGGMTEVSNGRLVHHDCHIKIHQDEQKSK